MEFGILIHIDIKGRTAEGRQYISCQFVKNNRKKGKIITAFVTEKVVCEKDIVDL